MLGSVTKPTTCGDNNNRIISAQQPQRCIIQQILNKMCAELSNSRRRRMNPMWPTYAKTPLIHLSISVFGVLVEHRDANIIGSDEMQKKETA